MTDIEKKQEEIRLLNLRVDELKEQNGHYSVQTEELKDIQSHLVDGVEKLKVEYSSLSAIKSDLESKVAQFESEIRKYEKNLGEVRSDFERESEKLKNAEARNVSEGLRYEELKTLLFDIENRLNLAQGDLSVKYSSLKGFEEQLLIKEGLLNKREEILDLKEKGVKINE